jgi:hypothetical protein
MFTNKKVKSERHSCERQTATTQLQGIFSFLFVFPFKYIYQSIKHKTNTLFFVSVTADSNPEP